MKCRLCLTNIVNRKGIPLFNNDEETNLIKLIAKYLYIQVEKMDNFANMVCKDCFQQLNDFHKYFQYVEQQQLTLQKEVLNIEERREEIEMVANVDGVPTNDLHTDDESMLDLKDVMNDSELLDGQLSMKEFGLADDCELEIDTDEDLPLQKLKTEICRSKVTKKATLKKLRCVKRNTKRKYQSGKKKLVQKPEPENSNSEKNNEEDANNVSVSADEKVEKSKNYLSLEENKLRDELVSKHIDLKCEICNTQNDTYESLKVHFRKEHNKKAFFTCCGKRFVRRFLLLDHIQSHLNPELFKCKICDKVLKSRVSLNLHNANMHVDREEMKNACSICGKRFKHPSNLNTHMNVHAKDRNFICEICQKGFKSKNLLKMHIQNQHGEKTPYICETCGKEYKFKMSFDRHVAGHLGQPQEPAQCKICGNWYTQYNLRRHMKRHILENVDCEICGKTFKSKVALTSHVKGSHQKREKMFSCTFCGKTFERPRYLKEHIDMHTGQKEYKCSYCIREFRSKANMYAHVKKIHHEQWAEAKQARNRIFENSADNRNLNKINPNAE